MLCWSTLKKGVCVYILHHIYELKIQAYNTQGDRPFSDVVLEYTKEGGMYNLFHHIYELKLHVYKGGPLFDVILKYTKEVGMYKICHTTV